jgi:carboxyl-terminal processing protease
MRPSLSHSPESRRLLVAGSACWIISGLDLREPLHADGVGLRDPVLERGAIPASKQALWLLALQFAPAMLAKTPVVLETEGLGRKEFHGKVILLVNRHTASAAEMIVAFARENNLARIVGEKTAGKLLSATSVKVGQGFRLALPTGAYYTWSGSVLEGTPIEPDELVEFNWHVQRTGKDQQLGSAINSLYSRPKKTTP